MPTGLTDVDVVNAALQQVAAQTTITSLADGSQAADAALIIYTPTVELMLRLLEPDFARVTNTLALTGITPQYPMTHEYGYPSDCLRLLQVRPTTYDALDPQPYRANIASEQIGVGSITFSALPTNSDTITLNGAVFTWVTSGASPSNYQINITGNTAGAVAIWLNHLQNSATYLADPLLNVANYSETVTSANVASLDITYKTAGTAGQSYTLAKSCSVATLSGASLNVAGFEVIQTTLANALAVYISSTVTEAEWSPTFTDAVVRRLANPLAMALSGRPDFAKELLEQSMRSAAMDDAVDESMIRPV